jgi:hypothetical protein
MKAWAIQLFFHREVGERYSAALCLLLFDDAAAALFKERLRGDGRVCISQRKSSAST